MEPDLESLPVAAGQPRCGRERTGWKVGSVWLSIHLEMGLFSKPSMVALLRKEQPALDRIFGEGAYEIDSAHPQHARLRSALLEIGFGCERDGEIGALITLRDPPEEVGGSAGAWLWARLLGVETATLERDRHGRVREVPEAQTRLVVELIERLVNEIFSDPRRLRDAAFFVEGHTRAYNEWSSGEWDVLRDD